MLTVSNERTNKRVLERIRFIKIMKVFYIIIAVLIFVVGVTSVFFALQFVFYDEPIEDLELPLLNCDGSKHAPKGCQGLVMVTRSEWVAQPATAHIEDMITLAESLLLSYTQTNDSCNDIASCKLFIRNLQNNEINGMNYTDIRYNFLIDTGGRFYEGRGWTKLPAIDKSIQILVSPNSYYLGLIGNRSDANTRIVQYRAVQIFARQAVRSGNLQRDFDYFCSDEAFNRSFTTTRDRDPILKLFTKWYDTFKKNI